MFNFSIAKTPYLVFLSVRSKIKMDCKVSISTKYAQQIKKSAKLTITGYNQPVVCERLL